MPYGLLLAEGGVNSVVTPAGVIRPILLLPNSVNQRLPSLPAVMLTGTRFVTNSMIPPLTVILPIRLPVYSVNQRLPSGPVQMPFGWLPAVGSVNSVIV